MPDPVEVFYKEFRDRRATGALVDETAYYPPIEHLFTAVGAGLSPAVRCFSGLKNLGAGMPDLGLFTPDQYRPRATLPRSRQAPARGVVEIKPPSDNLRVIAERKQVKEYLEEYGLVLISNCRAFQLLRRKPDGAVEELDQLELAPDETSFWTLTDSPRKSAGLSGAVLVDYLKRVMVRKAPITKPEQLAWLLASYAQEGLVRVEAAPSTSLDTFRREMTESLGLTFSGPNGERFFRSTFVQTLFYGLFSAWILWISDAANRTRAFDWKTEARSLELPVIGPLFGGLTLPVQLGPLRLEEVLNWAEDALNRVDQSTFFARFQKEHAIQLFYEPFLEQFDPKLKKDLGVWYTPPEVVQYMVERVDHALRTELGLADGLADESVYVLDPCCGTGSYLLEVLRKIAKTVEMNSGGAIAPARVKAAAIERVFGFEILPAPFVVSHFQIDLLLRIMGAPFSQTAHERASVYLTNSLIGWEPPLEGQRRLTSFFHLEEEREKASEVKLRKPILVILGNPPYNAFAGTSPAEEYGLVEPYKEGLRSEWRIRKFNLDDLYIRFFRLAERRIAEQTGKGIICYISNFSYLSHPSFVVMRKRLLSEFPKIWIDCLNGDSRETGKLTPTGDPDPSIFSTESNREGIRVGTAVGMFVKPGLASTSTTVRYRSFWGTRKRLELMQNLAATSPYPPYAEAKPSTENRFSFRAAAVPARYSAWPTLRDIARDEPISGPQEVRERAFIVPKADSTKLSVLREYLDPSLSTDDVVRLEPRLMKGASGFDPVGARKLLLDRKVAFQDANIVPYIFKPFDLQVAYLDPRMQPLFFRPRPKLLRIHRETKPLYIASRDTSHSFPEGHPLYFSTSLIDFHSIATSTKLFPFYLSDGRSAASARLGQSTLAGGSRSVEQRVVANLSDRAHAYLRDLDAGDASGSPELAELLWFHVLAIAYSSKYVLENEDGIRTGWPRVPLPKDLGLLKSSSTLGQSLGRLIDPTSNVPGVTSGDIRLELGAIANIQRIGGGLIDPSRGDLNVTAAWGRGSLIVMPGRGKAIERDYLSEEKDAMNKGAARLGKPAHDIVSNLGVCTRDVFLNESAFWKNVPDRVWSFSVGGSQVCKKWLSYREREVLGRSLTADEVVEFTSICRRVAAVLLLQPELNRNYDAVAASAYAWTP